MTVESSVVDLSAFVVEDLAVVLVLSAVEEVVSASAYN